MSEFEKPLPSVRLAETHRGDDLQAVAARELGDANRWPELVWINRLSFPYLTDDDRLSSATVLLTGSLIKVPAPAGTLAGDADRDQAYGRDCLLVKRKLTADGAGDFAIVSGVDNLTQQLQHRVITPRGQARRHPEYGCLVWRLLGSVTGPVAGALGAQYVQATLAADHRVSAVLSSTADVRGDAVRVMAKVQAIEGGAVDLVAGSASS